MLADVTSSAQLNEPDSFSYRKLKYATRPGEKISYAGDLMVIGSGFYDIVVKKIVTLGKHLSRN